MIKLKKSFLMVFIIHQITTLFYDETTYTITTTNHFNSSRSSIFKTYQAKRIYE